MSYVPSSDDVEWTKNVIQGITIWNIPNAASVIHFDHEKLEFRVFMINNPTGNQVESFSRVRKNLIQIGYTPLEGRFIENSENTNDILKIIGFTEKQIDDRKTPLVSSTGKVWNKDTWHPSPEMISFTKDHISGLGEGALWVIPAASAIMKISHNNYNYTFVIGINQIPDETIYMFMVMEIMKRIDYECGGIFVDEAEITLQERVKNIAPWFSESETEKNHGM